MGGKGYDLTYAICAVVAVACVVIGLVANASLLGTVHAMNSSIKQLGIQQDEQYFQSEHLQNQIDELNKKYIELQAQVRYGLHERYGILEE